MNKFIPIFPEVVDNSMRKELVKCQKAAHYRYEMGLRSIGQTKVDLHAGKAFAKAMQVMRHSYYFTKLPDYEALAAGVKALYEAYGDFPCPKDSNKSADRMAGALTYFVEKNPLAESDLTPIALPNGKVGLEVGFQIETDVIHPISNKRIIYGGRMDMLALSREKGNIWIVDEKTTKQLGDKWANQWQMDSQITGYYMATRKLLDSLGLNELEIGGAIINGISIKKYDYEHVPVEAYRQDWEIQRWWRQYNRDLVEWVSAFREGSHSYALDHACAYYNNPCEYVTLCKSRNPERVMEGNYSVEHWNPLDEAGS